MERHRRLVAQLEPVQDSWRASEPDLDRLPGRYHRTGEPHHHALTRDLARRRAA